MLRRTPEDTVTQDSNVLTYGNLSVDLEQCAVHLNGREIRLTPTEFRILSVLIREPGRVFSRNQLVEQSMGFNYEGMERTVDVHVLKLRRKLEQDPNHLEYILTVYGMGYKFGG